MCIGIRYRGRVSQGCSVNTRKEIPLPSLNSDGRVAWLTKCDGEVFYRNIYYSCRLASYYQCKIKVTEAGMGLYTRHAQRTPDSLRVMVCAQM